MLFWTIVKVSLKSLLGNKMRSFLTMLGVIIGVAAVIIVVAIGQGLKQDTLERIQRLGTNLIMVRPGASGSFDIGHMART